jgi:hypothetical protein
MSGGGVATARGLIGRWLADGIDIDGERYMVAAREVIALEQSTAPSTVERLRLGPEHQGQAQLALEDRRRTPSR